MLLPIALGASAIAQYIGQGHSLIFIAGGFLMIFFGMWSFWGHSMLPQIHLPVNLKRSDTPSVFTLGVFSGVASSCCAPVLAGILVLTTLSTSTVEALFVGLAYVFGMIFPLLMTAVAWDRKASRAGKFLQGRMVHIKFFTMEVDMHSSKLIAGFMFVVMGALTAILGFTNTMLAMPGSELIGIYQTAFEQAIVNAISTQEFATIVSLSLLLILVVYIALLGKKGRTHKVAIAPYPK